MTPPTKKYNFTSKFFVLYVPMCEEDYEFDRVTE